MSLYRKVKQRIPNIATIYTDANSCYRLAFQRNGVTEPHIETKAQTHLIEASNSSIRDNLARSTDARSDTPSPSKCSIILSPSSSIDTNCKQYQINNAPTGGGTR